MLVLFFSLKIYIEFVRFYKGALYRERSQRLPYINRKDRHKIEISVFGMCFIYWLCTPFLLEVMKTFTTVFGMGMLYATSLDP